MALFRGMQGSGLAALAIAGALALVGCGRGDGDGDGKGKAESEGTKELASPTPLSELGSGADFTKVEPAEVEAASGAVDPSAISRDGIPAPIRGFAGIEDTGFRVAYARSSNPTHEQYRMAFQNERAFESIATELNKIIKLPRRVDVHIVNCGTVNAFYDPNSSRIIVCYELIDYFVAMFKPTATSQQELGMAVVGATFFGFFHELGHGLIHVLDLPATGREEDAVDQMATLVLMEGGDEGVQMALAGAQWFLLQGEKGGSDATGMPFWDEHSFDGQRFYNIICLVYGSDPDKYDGFVSGGHLPRERAERCPEEYQRVSRAWEKLLEPHIRTDATGATLAAGTSAEPPARAPPTRAPPAAAGEGITCEQVVDKAIDLIIDEAKSSLTEASDAEIDQAEEQLRAQLPAIAQDLYDECTDAGWPEKDKRCVLDATDLQTATTCGM